MIETWLEWLWLRGCGSCRLSQPSSCKVSSHFFFGKAASSTDRHFSTCSQPAFHICHVCFGCLFPWLHALTRNICFGCRFILRWPWRSLWPYVLCTSLISTGKLGEFLASAGSFESLRCVSHVRSLQWSLSAILNQCVLLRHLQSGHSAKLRRVVARFSV
jgi:hypothetical protein